MSTKHNYQINHRYLWVCVGTPPSAAQGFLNLPPLPDEEGCGAEYGRHSKSIHPAKHRCGRCKGVLLQVRPKPKPKPKVKPKVMTRTLGQPAQAVPRKNDLLKKEEEDEAENGGGLQTLEEAMQVVRIASEEDCML